MEADIQSSGMWPLSRDVWKILIVSIGAISSAYSLKIFPGILSGPVALCGLRFFNNLETPSRPTWISGKSIYGLVPLSGLFERSSFVYTDWNWFLSIAQPLLPCRCKGVNPGVVGERCLVPLASYSLYMIRSVCECYLRIRPGCRIMKLS